MRATKASDSWSLNISLKTGDRVKKTQSEKRDTAPI